MISNPKKNVTRKPPRRSAPVLAHSAASIAKSFLDYYKSRGHTICPSASLVPDDPTLLFTSAGMVPFKAYYSDPDRAPYRTAASVQKCLRAGGKQSDLENVGRTLRHHTFFEMLGNFSFGDYFKKEAIDSAWELCVEVWRLDPGRIWISVYKDDDEAFDLWANRIGIPSQRIVRLGKKDNFWGPVGETGVCGPSSELYYDTGEDRGCGRPTCGLECDCDRYIEFWNLVFPQFFLTEAGKYDPLPRPGIDTGMGLERIAFILQEAEDNFHTDVFLPVRQAIEKSVPKASGEKFGLALNVACDHLRALVFALSDGVMPSNEGRGYVLRRLLRRAVTKMHPFGVRKPFMSAAVGTVVNMMAERYPELRQREGLAKNVITAEEEHFLSTVEQGWNRFQEVVEASRKSKSGAFPGKDAFTLYDTFGFPLELTSELASETGLVVDVEAYQLEMTAQKERSRKHHLAVMGEAVSRDDRAAEGVGVELKAIAETEFLGYTELACDAAFGRVDFLGADGRVIEATTDRTVFYPEGGGQVGDTGVIEVGDKRLSVTDTFRRDRRIVHRMAWPDAPPGRERFTDFFQSHPTGRLVVDRETRLSTARNHTATHLLHAALRKTLGEHVVQAGSLVAPDRLRFDFHHFQAMTPDQIDEVGRWVNGAVLADLPVDIAWLPREQAFAEGAMALFGEKYGDTARVVRIADVSKELCGGTHLRRTGEIGLFVIRQETAVAAGVRRIEALTGWGAWVRVRELLDGRAELSRELKVSPEDVADRVRTLVREHDALKRALAERERDQAGAGVEQAVRAARDVGGVRLGVVETESGDLASLRHAGDRLRGAIGLGVGLLCLTTEEKPIVLIVASDDAISKRGIKAGEIARRLAEEFAFRGGGKDHMAQLGMPHKSDFTKLVSFVTSWLEDQ
jgi:alanyl-tRNA synthetase